MINKTLISTIAGFAMLSTLAVTAKADNTPLIPQQTLSSMMERHLDSGDILMATPVVAVAKRQAILNAPAPGTQWSVLGYFNLRANSISEVIQDKWTTISLLGKYSNVTLDLSGFAGYDDKYNTAVAGISLTHSWHVANTGAGPVTFTAGGAASGAGQKGAFGVGAIFGLSLQF